MVNTQELYSDVLKSWEKHYAKCRARYYYIEHTTGTAPDYASEHLESIIAKINFYRSKID